MFSPKVYKIQISSLWTHLCHFIWFNEKQTLPAITEIEERNCNYAFLWDSAEKEFKETPPVLKDRAE